MLLGLVRGQVYASVKQSPQVDDNWSCDSAPRDGSLIYTRIGTSWTLSSKREEFPVPACSMKGTCSVFGVQTVAKGRTNSPPEHLDLDVNRRRIAQRRHTDMRPTQSAEIEGNIL